MSGTPVLATQGLTRRFGGLVAVNDVTMSVPQGQTLGVIGPNGSGKSTFINLVTGHLRPTKGSVLIDGKDLTDAKPWVIAGARVARTFQIVKPFRGMSVRENVAVGILYGPEGTGRMAPAPAEIEPSLALINTLKAGGMTIIVVEHVMKAILAVSDQVMVLNQGTLLMTGSPREVLSDPRVIEAYLGQKYAQRQAGGEAGA